MAKAPRPGLTPTEGADEDAVAEAALLKFGVFSLHLHSDANTGWPDRIYFIPGGRPLLIEHKRRGIADGRSERQKLIHARLTHAGYDVQTHNDPAAALAAVGAATLHAKGGKVPPGARSGGPFPRSRAAQNLDHISRAVLAKKA